MEKDTRKGVFIRTGFYPPAAFGRFLDLGSGIIETGASIARWPDAGVIPFFLSFFCSLLPVEFQIWTNDQPTRTSGLNAVYKNLLKKANSVSQQAEQNHQNTHTHTGGAGGGKGGKVKVVLSARQPMRCRPTDATNRKAAGRRARPSIIPSFFFLLVDGLWMFSFTLLAVDAVWMMVVVLSMMSILPP